MSDNVKVNPSLNNNAVSVATDDIDNVHYPIYKTAFGADGSVTQASEANPFPIELKGFQESSMIMQTELLKEILTELKILNAYNSLGHDETLTEDDI